MSATSSKLKDTYANIDSLLPFYSSTQSTARISNNEGKQIIVSAVFDEINIMVLNEDNKVEPLHKISNDDEQDITCLDVTSNGKFLTYINQAQLVTIRDLQDAEFKIVKQFKLSSPSYCVTSDLKSGNLLAIGCTDGSITIYDVDNGYITHSFKGHGGIISSLKIYGELESLNDWYLLSGDTNGTLKVWDLVKRKQLYTIQEHQSAIRGIDIIPSVNSADEFTVLTGGRDDICNIYKMHSANSKQKKAIKIWKTIPIGLQVEACGFISNKFFFAAGGDGVFSVYNIDENNKCFISTKKPTEELFIVATIPQYSNNKFDQLVGYYLVFSDQTISKISVTEIFNPKNNNIPVDFNIAGNHGTVADMRFVGPHLNKLALATNSSTLRLVPLEENKYECEMYEGHTDLLNSLDATEDGLWIATASKDNSAILWSYDFATDAFKPYCKFVGHIGNVTAVALPKVPSQAQQQKRENEAEASEFIAPPKWIVTASSDMTIKKWSVPKTVSPSEAITIVDSSDFTRKAHDKDINSIDVSPNDSYLATASYDKTCKIWNISDFSQVATLSGHKRGLWDVKFCQFDKMLVTSSGDKTCKVWSFKDNDDTFKLIGTLQGHSNAVQRAFFINGNKQVVSCGAEGLIKIWSLVDSNFECLNTLDGHNNRIWAILGKNDGEYFVSADADGVFQVWKDNSEEKQQMIMEEKKQKVEEEQSLNNYLRDGDWLNAFYLAMKLDHPMRLFNVLNRSVTVSENNVVGGTIFNEQLDKAISNLDEEQLLRLVSRCRDWNTNAKTFHIAGKVIRCILLNYNINHLIEIKGLVKIINTIVPYLTRHYNRLDNLIEETYILDFCLSDMDNNVV